MVARRAPIKRHRGPGQSPGIPATPPDKRVRIRRFEELSSRDEPGKPVVVEVPNREGNVNELRGVLPPAPVRSVVVARPAQVLVVDGGRIRGIVSGERLALAAQQEDVLDDLVGARAE